MVVACSYKILWPKIAWHILACFGPFLECKKAQNWNGRQTIVYGSINLKFFWGGPDTYTKLPCEEGSPNPNFFFFWSRLGLTWFWDDLKVLYGKCWIDDGQTSKQTNRILTWRLSPFSFEDSRLKMWFLKLFSYMVQRNWVFSTVLS